MMDIFDTPPKNRMTFNYLGTAIDPELRPLWRISLIALILLKLCIGNKANSKKIQALYSLMASEKKRHAYYSNFSNSGSTLRINIRFDPLVDRAVDIGLGETVFLLDDAKSIKLTDKGLAFARKIDKDTDVFIIEKAFISHFNKSHFNENVINLLINGGLS
jgi:hypothetical protein